ncbi:hypothetical protein JNB_08169 [Janibacter sp. HTCC2649]|nr:hypothetical protein JNB_08169 [Janibacter sp. HTCC2649]
MLCHREVADESADLALWATAAKTVEGRAVGPSLADVDAVGLDRIGTHGEVDAPRGCPRSDDGLA